MQRPAPFDKEPDVALFLFQVSHLPFGLLGAWLSTDAANVLLTLLAFDFCKTLLASVATLDVLYPELSVYPPFLLIISVD